MATTELYDDALAPDKRLQRKKKFVTRFLKLATIASKKLDVL
jgi:hypothetical protein